MILRICDRTIELFNAHAYLKYLLKLAENMKYIRGLAAELRGARLCMKVAAAIVALDWAWGSSPNTYINQD